MAHSGCSLLLADESRGENTFSVQHVMVASRHKYIWQGFQGPKAD